MDENLKNAGVMTAIKAAPLVWISGFPGSGKLTVATSIAMLHNTAIVFDNHKLIDPVEAKFPRTHPDYQKERQLYRKTVLDEYVCNIVAFSRLVIFTDFQSNNELGQNVAMEYKDAAYRAGRPFIPVYLTCNIDVNLERITNFGRVNSGTTKLTDAQVLKDMYSRCELFHFNNCLSLTVDSTNVPPLETAKKILQFLRDNNGYGYAIMSFVINFKPFLKSQNQQTLKKGAEALSDVYALKILSPGFSRVSRLEYENAQSDEKEDVVVVFLVATHLEP
ncbi:hypothetical protein B7463_g10595, partial [Scytalidium lignicola]